MKVPLIGILSPNTRNMRTGELQTLMYRNGHKQAATVPYQPYYYVSHPSGSTKKVLGYTEPQSLTKVHYKPNRDIISPNALFEGGREHLLERLCIEHPEFFLDYPNEAPLKSMAFDIETHSPDGSFPFGEKYPVVAIGIVTSTGEREVLLWDGNDDKNVITQFAEFISDYDPDIIYGWNHVGYDIPQILHRVRFHGIPEMEYKKLLNRDNSTYGWEQPKNQNELKMKAGGRVHIDLLRWARLDYSLSGLPRGLKSVSKAFGLNPIELSFDGKVLLDYSMEEIEEYVLSDVDCTKHMFEHYFPQIEYTAEILGVPLETYVNAPASFITKILQGRGLFEQGILTLDFNKERHPEIFKADRGNFQAAFIELYSPGFHKDNYKADFSGFYPSIAMALNLGPDKSEIIGYEDYIEEIEYKDGVAYIPDNKIGKRVLVKLDFSDKSVLYKISEQFMEMRKPWKKIKTKEANSKSNALKIMVNTFYGANTNPYISYGDMGVGITITAVARWLLLSGVELIKNKYGKDSVVYVHTDGINTNCDIDVNWLTKRLRLLLKNKFPECNEEWIKMDKDVFKEGFWLQIGNYVLRNEDGSLTKHGSTFKSRARSKFYIKTLDKLIDARLDNKINAKFIEELYSMDDYKLEDFLQRRTMNRNKKDYKSKNDLIMQMIIQGEEIGLQPEIGTTYSYYKTKNGYRIEQLVNSKIDLDVKYHWDIITKLLNKFQLEDWSRKNAPLTLIDPKQKSLMEFI